jgi:hypothetical protein
MNPTISRLLHSLVIFVFCGCAQDVANRYYSSQRYAPKPAKDVALLFSAPGRPFTVIADLQSRNESPERMRKRAALIGADAIIVSPVGGLYRVSEEWAGSDNMSHSYSRLIGSAIKYNK